MKIVSGEVFQKWQPLQEAWVAEGETLGNKSTGIKKCYSPSEFYIQLNNSDWAELHICK